MITEADEAEILESSLRELVAGLERAGIDAEIIVAENNFHGRTLGIVGYGNIGKQLSVVAEAFGMNVYFYDIVDRLAMGNATKCDSLEQLLNTVETVTLHVDGRESNTAMFGREQFRQMRPRSLFLNLSRGHVVDIEALHEALAIEHEKIAGGVDSAIEIGVVDEKIDPAHTRSKLTQALAEAPARRGRHKNIPL
mgnify:CR=1 FL=1